MNLEQIAQQAMDYLDSVGVAADYEIVTRKDKFLFVPIRKKSVLILLDGESIEIKNNEDISLLHNLKVVKNKELELFGEDAVSYISKFNGKAKFEIKDGIIFIKTKDFLFFDVNNDINKIVKDIKSKYQQKSPN